MTTEPPNETFHCLLQNWGYGRSTEGKYSVKYTSIVSILFVTKKTLLGTAYSAAFRKSSFGNNESPSSRTLSFLCPPFPLTVQLCLFASFFAYSSSPLTTSSSHLIFPSGFCSPCMPSQPFWAHFSHDFSLSTSPRPFAIQCYYSSCNHELDFGPHIAKNYIEYSIRSGTAVSLHLRQKLGQVKR